jgi:mitochondrial cardiolipin hydrolase
LQTALRQAKHSIDVCVFSITCDEIANELLAAHQRGVAVRIISDDDQMKTQGSDVARLAAAGIATRTDNSPFHMHNKFAVIDGSLLINGSFNWTRQAVLNNRENIVITNNAGLVAAFAGEFHKLWDLYASNRV